MASNTTLNSGTGGDVIATKERTHDGDATKVQVVTVAGVTGTEGAYTFTDVAAGGGVEAAALRVTIASDSTGVVSVDDNGGSLTVDGTVSVTGVATAANQTTIIGHLDGVEGLLTTIDADTGSLAGCVAGTELQVDIVAGGITGRAEDTAHSTGHEGVVVLAVRRDTAAVGSDTDGDYSTINVNSAGRVYTSATVDAALPAGDNNIGNVDIVTMPNVTLAAGTNTNEVVGDVAQDAAVAGNPLLMGGRASTATPSAMSADGDSVYQWMTRNGAAVTAGELVDDSAFTPGTSRVHPIGLQADETSTDSIDEGDIGAPRMSLDRKQYVIAHNETSTIYQNGTARTPAFAIIDAATSGDNTLLAAQGASNKIRVHQLFLVAAGTTTVRFESGAGGTALTGQMNLVANTGFVLPYSPIGWFETAANTLLNLELSAAVSVDGSFAYTVVT